MSRFRTVLLASVAALLVAYGSGGNADGDSQGDAREITIEGVTVVYDGLEYPVSFEGIEVQEVNGIWMIPLSAVLKEAELPVEVPALVFDFESDAGYRPALAANCRSHVPLPGESIPKGWVNLEKGSIYFDESVEASGCFEVPDVAFIYAFDQESHGSIVTVGEQEHAIDVDLRFLPAYPSNGRLVVSMDQIVKSAMNSPQIYLFELVANDGFNPAYDGQLGPLSYGKLQIMNVDLMTRKVSWPGGEEIDPLWGFERLAQVLYLDPKTESGSVVVEEETDTFLNQEEVPLGAMATVEFNGEQLIPLYRVVETAGIIDNYPEKFYSLTSSYGNDPHDQFNGSLVWVDLLNGYIHPVSRNVQFDVNVGVKGYWNVADAAKIRVVESSG